MPLGNQHLSVLWPAFPVLIALSLWFGVKAGGDNLLHNRTAPSGISSLARAGSVDEARKVIASWNHKARDRRTQSDIENENFITANLSNDGRMLTDVAKRSLIFDLFFISSYSSVLAVACLLAAAELAVRRRKQKSRWVMVGIRLAFLPAVIAGFDVIENFALWRMLENSTVRLWPWLAYGCSIVKCFLIAMTLLYCFSAFVYWAFDNTPPLRKRPTATA